MCSRKRLVWAMMLLLMSLNLTGYAAPARLGVEFCDHAQPVYVNSRAQVDATPPPIRRQILERNKGWRKLCEH